MATQQQPTPPDKLSDDAYQFIDGIIKDPAASGHMRTQTVLKALLTKPRSNFQRAIQHDITTNPDKMEEVLEKTTTSDFRAFLRDEILEKEKENISGSLADLRKADPEAYNKALQGWAKIALPSQPQTNINVEIRQKADMYSRIQRQYGLSQLADDVESTPVEELPNPEPEQKQPVFVENEPKVVAPYDTKAAMDPTFYDTKEDENDFPY